MAEYIEREKLMQKFADHVKRSNNSDFAQVPTWNQAVQIVEDSPAADVVERKHGEWIYQFHEDEVGVTCSECEGYAESFARWIYDEGYRVDYNYCPNCGAEMDGEEDGT